MRLPCGRSSPGQLVEELWYARPGTTARGRLEVLATLVEDWEEKHQPIYPPDPVAATRFRMEQLDLDRKALEPSIGSGVPLRSVSQVARQLGVCTATVYALCAKGALKHVRVLNAIRVAQGDLEAFVESRRAKV